MVLKSVIYIPDTPKQTPERRNHVKPYLHRPILPSISLQFSHSPHIFTTLHITLKKSQTHQKHISNEGMLPIPNPKNTAANLTLKSQVIDPQSAVLTNIEVLAYLTANPPRRPPNPPPNLRHWVPSPDLRDHNTVVKEVHISCCLLKLIQIHSSTHTSTKEPENQSYTYTKHQSSNPVFPKERQTERERERGKLTYFYYPDPQLCLPPLTPSL